MTSNIVTTDHEEIRRWAEKRGGRPARVIGATEEDGTGGIRIDFPGEPAEEALEEISWTEFFERFERKKLAFCYQDEVWLH
ncbi:hypothetical protein EHM82_02005 [bacterium]|nr:MAG: hypothetical protein EHM82_02005 [bacterium]